MHPPLHWPCLDGIASPSYSPLLILTIFSALNSDLVGWKCISDSYGPYISHTCFRLSNVSISKVHVLLLLAPSRVWGSSSHAPWVASMRTLLLFHLASVRIRDLAERHHKIPWNPCGYPAMSALGLWLIFSSAPGNFSHTLPSTQTSYLFFVNSVMGLAIFENPSMNLR